MQCAALAISFLIVLCMSGNAAAGKHHVKIRFSIARSSQSILPAHVSPHGLRDCRDNTAPGGKPTHKSRLQSRLARAVTLPHQRGEVRSYVDLDSGMFYRLAEGKRETKKRQPPVPIPPRLLAHLQRWKAKGLVWRHVIEWYGEPIKSVKTAFKSAASLAGLGTDVTPHTLRHTAATWLMQAGVDKWEAAGFLGMSVEMLDRVYGHQHPLYLRQAANAIGYRRQKETLSVSLSKPKPANSNATQVVDIVGGARSDYPTSLAAEMG